MYRNSSLHINSKLEYLKTQYQKDYCEAQQSVTQTGFENIDNTLSIKKGLYLIGGVPSVGKTTFLVQLVDQFAMQDNRILFISLEQNEFDLTYKSVRRLKHIHNLKTEQQAIEQYLTFAENITTVTTTTSVSINDIQNTIEEFANEVRNKQNKTPIVVIDYLQLIKYDSNLTAKEGVSYISNVLIGLKKKYGLVLFVLSSLNRANYMSSIDFESFKESGNLEYDADVVLGIQYQIMTNEKFESSNTSVNTKRRLILEAKTESVRDVEIVCLKNRMGAIPEKWTFQYYTDYDCFIPVTESTANKSSRTKNNTPYCL